MPMCEGRKHQNEFGEEPILPPTEGRIHRIYKGEDHFFCSDACWRGWWFFRKKNDGEDVSKIPLTRQGKEMICAQCDRPILYGELKDYTSITVEGDPKIGTHLRDFCCWDHRNRYIRDHIGELFYTKNGTAVRCYYCDEKIPWDPSNHQNGPWFLGDQNDVRVACSEDHYQLALEEYNRGREASRSK